MRLPRSPPFAASGSRVEWFRSSESRSERFRFPESRSVRFRFPESRSVRNPRRREIPEGGKSQRAGDPGERDFGRRRALALKAVHSSWCSDSGTAERCKAEKPSTLLEQGWWSTFRRAANSLRHRRHGVDARALRVSAGKRLFPTARLQPTNTLSARQPALV